MLFALIDRTKYIQRWSLMRNAQVENLAEHSFYATQFLPIALLVYESFVFLIKLKGQS